MNIVQKFINSFKLQTSANDDNGDSLPVARYLTERWAFANVNTWASVLQAYKDNPIVQGCSLAYQLTIPEAALIVVDDRDNVLTNHPLYQLLEKSKIKSILARAMLYITINGNAFIYMARVGGVVKQWQIYSSEYITPVVDRFGNVIKYVYKTGNETIDIAPEDIIHLTAFWLDPERMWMGMSPIQLARTSVLSYNEATQSIYSLHKNDEVPKTALLYEEQLTEQQVEAARYAFRQRHGNENRGTTAHVWGVRDIKRLGLGWNEMGMSETFMQLEARICSTYRVHPIIAFTYAGLMKSTYANFAQASKDFTTYSRIPLWEILQEQLTDGIRTMYPNLSLRFDLSTVEALRPNISELRKEARDLFDRGAISLAELRAAHDYDATSQMAKHGYKSNKQINNYNIKNYNIKTGQQWHELDDATYIKAREELQKPSYDALTASILNVLNDLGDAVTSESLSNLTGDNNYTTLSKKIDWEAWSEKLQMATEEERIAIIKEAIKLAIEETSGDVGDDFSEAERAGVDESSAKIKDSIGTIRDDVRQLLRTNADMTEAELRASLRTMFTNMNEARAAMIARTTSTASTGVSQKMVWQEMNNSITDDNLKIRRTWIAFPGARPAHASASGELESEEGLFTVGGETTPYPAGPGLSAANAVNCRCITRPIRQGRL